MPQVSSDARAAGHSTTVLKRLPERTEELRMGFGILLACAFQNVCAAQLQSSDRRGYAALCTFMLLFVRFVLGPL